MTVPIRLLLVEDTAADAELIVRELKRASLEVMARRVETEVQFRELLAADPVDVILADYSLPNFDGAAALEIAHELVPEIPFIFVSGSIGEERAIEALHNGATDYILKDRLSRLGPAVIRAIDERRQAQIRRAAQDALRESELRFRSVAESAADGILLTRPDSTIIYANQQAASMFGMPAAVLVQKSVSSLLPEYARNEYLSALQDFEQDASASLSMLTIALGADGSEFPVETLITTWKRDGELFLTHIMRDVSDRIAAERRQHTQFAVTRLLAEARSPVESLPELIRLICEGLGWTGGVMWLSEPQTERLKCAGVWFDDESDRKTVAQACADPSSAPGDGLPGIAFASGAVQTGTLAESRSFLRHHEAAAAAGIASATAIPVRIGQAWLGVLEFFEHDAADQSASARLAVTTDIAKQLAQYLERARTEEERLAAEERLREAQRLAHVGSWEYDVSNGDMIWSEEVYSILGADAATTELSLAQYLRSVAARDRDRVQEIITSQLQKGEPETIHFQHQIENAAEERLVECRSRVVLGEDGRVLRAIGSIQDITEVTSSARTIKRLSHLNQMILDSTVEGVLGIDRSGKFNFINPAALTILGWPEEALRNIDNSHAAIHHTKLDGTPYPIEECPIRKTLADRQERSVTGEYFWRPDGQPFLVDYETAPIVEEDELVGVVFTFRDVTDSHRLERQLELAKRIGSLGRVAATMAHEFNNVLMGIEPFAEIIRRRGKDDENLIKSANQISSSVRRGRRVTDEILRFSRPAEPVLKVIDVGEWLGQLEPELRALAGPAVRISLSIPEGPVNAAADAAQLQQVVTNLVVNARDAMGNAGEISIVLAVPEGQGAVEILVRDTGEGIPRDVMDNIFEPLFTTKRIGTGLGLSVARQVIAQHGGTIEAQNRPGGGAQFLITLPFGTPSPSFAVTKQAATHTRVHRVLLVEDDELVSAGLCALLEAEGMTCHVVNRGAMAVDAVAAFAPDEVILDLTLPDMDGADVFRLIRARWPALPVIFSTGNGSESEFAWALASERVELLQKPYDFDTLLAAVDRVAAPSPGEAHRSRSV